MVFSPFARFSQHKRTSMHYSKPSGSHPILLFPIIRHIDGANSLKKSKKFLIFIKFTFNNRKHRADLFNLIPDNSIHQKQSECGKTVWTTQKTVWTHKNYLYTYKWKPEPAVFMRNYPQICFVIHRKTAFKFWKNQTILIPDASYKCKKRERRF